MQVIQVRKSANKVPSDKGSFPRTHVTKQMAGNGPQINILYKSSPLASGLKEEAEVVDEERAKSAVCSGRRGRGSLPPATAHFQLSRLGCRSQVPP